jgi:hypothetical protein
LGEGGGLIAKSKVDHNKTFVPATRRAQSVEFDFADKAGATYQISLEPLQRFYMLGIGYNHVEWGHGYWKGELETCREDWNLDEVNELDYPFIHNHQVVKATMGDQVGYGTFESIIIGRHSPSGFKDFFDGAE